MQKKDLVSKTELNDFLIKQKPGPKLLIASTVIVAILLILGLFGLVKLTLIIIWAIWFVIIFAYSKGHIKKLLPLRLMFIILTVFSVIFVFVWPGTALKSGENNTSTQLTIEECRPYIEKYNDKILKISSDGLQGTIGIKIDTSSGGCKLKGYYNVLLSYNLPQNPYEKDLGAAYHYIVMIRNEDEQKRTEYDSYGALSSVYKNFYNLPEPFADSVERSNLYYTDETATSTRFFSWGYEIETNFSEQRYQQIFEKNKLEIVDGLDYIEEEKNGDTVFSWGINHEKAAVGGEIVKSYILTIEE